MYQKIFLIFVTCVILISCSKKEPEISSKPSAAEKAFEVYQEALDAFNNGDIFFASKKFNEAELIMPKIEYSAKAALMSGYCFYTINFYPEALETLERYLKKYPADENIPYAHYLVAIIYYEQILDVKKDIQPLNKSKEKINFYLKKYPDTEYSLDLEFKLDLINNQLAAKELYVAKFYIETQKWIPAIRRLKNIVENYNETVFIEEALHRLVEVYYKVGLESEAKAAAAILGYNYNSSEWYQQSYKILNKEYVKPPLNKNANKKESGLILRTIKKIIKK